MTEPHVLSVSQLTALIQGTLEATFPAVWVGGEVSEVTRPSSGHVYFTLKDARAKISAVIWRSASPRIKFKLEEGQQVVCHGDINVYPPHGKYQLNVQQVEPQGVGALQLAFKQLQQRLAAEGLFDPIHKKPLPPFPRRVGFVTSPTGAAIRDFLEVAGRRFRGVEILVIPARVQGECAADEVVRGIELANHLRPPLDVLVVGRGGGSIEDLWCFNEESVVRAIFASRLPVVSAVGHEIDVTLSDLVADVRALTPSEAAERVVPSADELLARLGQYQRRMTATLRGRATAARSRVEQLAKSRVLRNPQTLIYDLSHRVDELSEAGQRAVRRRLSQLHDRLSATAARLESLSPLAVLARGYSVTTNERGEVLRDAAAVSPGEVIHSRLARGEVVSRVENRDSSAPVPREGPRIQ